MTYPERYFIASFLIASAMLAVAWIAFQIQQQQIAPAVLFSLAVGAVMALSLVGIRRLTGVPGRRATICAAIGSGLLLGISQDYIGHRHWRAHFEAELRRAHPLAAALADDGGLRSTFTDYLSRQWRARPGWRTLDVLLTIAAAGLVAALTTNAGHLWRMPPPRPTDRQTVDP